MADRVYPFSTRIVNQSDEARVEYLMLRHRARRELPPDWFDKIEAEAVAAVPRSSFWLVDEVGPRRAVWARWLDEYGGTAAAGLSDSDIKALALQYENEAAELEIGSLSAGAWFAYDRIVTFCRHRGGVPPGPELLIDGIARRVCCRYWWRRAIRKSVARKAEAGAMALGLVSHPNAQPYASNKAVFRRLDQNKRNREAMENTVLENEDGQRATLAELASKSVGNKAIRRGELMTRIRGCEVIADSQGMPGEFLTLTCPSRFHSTLRNGRRNPKHDGSTPREAQLWLRTMWARARAKLKRMGVEFFGFRVAEPHHDGCPHWHALLWSANAENLALMVSTMRDYWLSDDGTEQGAEKYRVNSKRMEGGAAAGYIAKYISKNIDDVGLGDDGHIDDYADSPIYKNLFGEVEVLPSMRVEAWASTWGIRQFQPVGQPPVTVWRELRRVTLESAKAAGQGGVIHRAWIAAQGYAGVRGALGAAGRAQRLAAEGRASWSDYCAAQGGVMQGRRHRVAVAVEVQEVQGQYGKCVRAVPLGVRLNWPGTACVYSERRAWRVIDRAASPVLGGAPTGAAATARTRVNNCTRRDANRHNRPIKVHRVATEHDLYGAESAHYRLLERLRRREVGAP